MGEFDKIPGMHEFNFFVMDEIVCLPFDDLSLLYFLLPVCYAGALSLFLIF